MNQFRRFARLLGGEATSDGVLCPGPGHSPTDRSLSVKFDNTAPGGFIVNSFAGDDPIICKDYVRERLGLDPFKPGNGEGPKPTPKQPEILPIRQAPPATCIPVLHTELRRHVYRTAEGLEAKVKIKRTGNKYDQWFNINGQWQNSKPKDKLFPIIPYVTRSIAPFDPGLIDDEIFWPEGERDVDTLDGLNLPAFTFGGITDPRPEPTELARYVKGRKIVVLADNDDRGGPEHAQAKAKDARAAGAASAQVVMFDVKDVSDFFAIGNTVENLRQFVGAAAKLEEPKTEVPSKATPLPFIDMSGWDNEPLPEREWAVLNRIPLKQTALISGEGGAGKSAITLHLCCAHTLARDWLLTCPTPGPAIFIDAEDDERELHIRVGNIAQHYGVAFNDLTKGGLHLMSFVGKDAVLATLSRSGKIEPTPLYQQILEAAGDIKPVMIGIASSANVFAGSENDRSQVQQFVALLTRIGMVANGSVQLIGHPSLTGISTDTGLSGSTQWHNAVRARSYLRGIKPDAGEQPDTDLREIVFKKNQYGPIGETIVLRYQNGLFLPVPGVANLDKAARDAQAAEIFIALLRRFTRQNRMVSDKPGTSYAPALFAKEDEAIKAGLSSKNLAAAMRELFKAGKIWNEPYGRPSRPSYRIMLRDGAPE